MLNYFRPLDSKESLRWFLLKLKEDKELDALVKVYIQNCLEQRIIATPSPGRYGEQGKDIAAIENEDTLEYCSYVIKRGNLQNNLDGKYGISKQMRDAILIEMRENIYKGKKRTAVVVYNGEDGSRSAVDKYLRAKESAEQCIDATLLLRPIERWDLEAFLNKLWNHIDKLRKSVELENINRQMIETHNAMVDFKIRYEKIKHDPQPEKAKVILVDSLYNSLVDKESKTGNLRRIPNG